jgi:hypothetical protein
MLMELAKHHAHTSSYFHPSALLTLTSTNLRLFRSSIPLHLQGSVFPPFLRTPKPPGWQLPRAPRMNPAG